MLFASTNIQFGKHTVIFEAKHFDNTCPGKNANLGTSAEKTSVMHLVCIVFHLARLIALAVSTADPSLPTTFTGKKLIFVITDRKL